MTPCAGHAGRHEPAGEETAHDEIARGLRQHPAKDGMRFNAAGAAARRSGLGVTATGRSA